MKKPIILALLISLSMLIIFSCQSDDSGSSNTNTGTNNPVGTWSTDCQSMSMGAYSISNEFTATDTAIDFAYTTYTDATCSLTNERYDYSYTYTLGAESAGTYPMDLTLVSIKLTVFDATTVDDYNTASVCGINDWAVGVTRDVTGGSNCGVSAVTYPSAGTVSYTIYKDDGTTANFGLLYNPTDGTSEATRPTVLDTSATSTYTKQP